MTTELILVLVMLTNLKLLGSSRLGASIRVVAAQGVMLGLLPVLAHVHELSLHFAALAVGTIALKGVVFPWLLFRALREAEVTREVEPYRQRKGFLGDRPWKENLQYNPPNSVFYLTWIWQLNWRLLALDALRLWL